MRGIGSVLLVLLLVCLLSPAAARRPGVGRGRIRPTPAELSPLPPGILTVPVPERSAVEAVPIATWLPEGTRLVHEEPEAFQPEPEPAAGPPTPTCGSYTETDLRPVRQQWDSGNGYCGEMSLQMTAMTRGIYISQKTSRKLGVMPGVDHPDLLFDERVQPVNAMSGVYGVAKMLGLYQPPDSYWYMDNQTLTAAKTLAPPPSSFAAWVKQNVMAGRPVITGVRVRGGGYPDYDHIMPIFGVCYSSANGLANGDIFVMTDDYMAELKHTPADRYFYAKYRACGYTGCIPNDFQDMGVAVGPLNVPANLYYPVKIAITGWSDGSAVNFEPGEYSSTTATAAYTLTVSGLTAGQSYKMYRTTGLFPGYQIPQSDSALAAACAAQRGGCNSLVFTATGPTMGFTHTSLGQFPATGITYFLVVKS